MKNGYIYLLKSITIITLLIGLYAFGNYKNDARKVTFVKVNIINNQQLLITPKMVRNLLIESLHKGHRSFKGQISLNSLEKALQANHFIARNDIYLSTDGQLHAKVWQKTPILRVQSSNPYYIDSNGTKMPLSPVFTPRLPVYLGNNINNDELYNIGQYLRQDSFLQEHLTSIWREGNDYMMSVRSQNFNIRFGSATRISHKFSNLKAFYQRALQEDSLEKYKEINLKYKNQVICKKN